MDEFEFLQLLELFPVVRSRDYYADLDYSRQLTQSTGSNVVGSSRQLTQSITSISRNDSNEAFWGKLKLAAEQKVGAADAERFCKAFQQVYKKLVYEELTLDAARRFINS